ncbi:MAG TPA: cell division protein ZapA [Alphaproteobacteria bacterium]|nr:cell division protein ZapA [Alphaproteobacteria bacterium]
MARVDVTFNGRVYPIACDDGQEQRVREIAAYVDVRLAEVKASVRSASDAHLLLMVCLLLGDELFDMRAALDGNAPADASGDGADGAEAAEAVSRIAGRIEAIAARLERT